jgi:hypothetical protein
MGAPGIRDRFSPPLEKIENRGKSLDDGDYLD